MSVEREQAERAYERNRIQDMVEACVIESNVLTVAESLSKVTDGPTALMDALTEVFQDEIHAANRAITEEGTEYSEEPHGEKLPLYSATQNDLFDRIGELESAISNLAIAGELFA